MSKKWKVGEIRNGYEVLPKEKRKKLLILADDLRLHSGVATMTKEFVLGIVHHFNIIQLGAAVKHPEQGKVFDLSTDVNTQTGLEDSSVRVIPWDGYGNPTILRQLLDSEKPDALIHFTDPRYWIWLYQMEHEVRRICPIIFYAIWDNVPDPEWNRPYYASCDHIACISKQTYGIVKRLTQNYETPLYPKLEDWQISHVQHGVNQNIYKPLSSTDIDLKLKRSVLGDKDYDFIVFWMNRNIKRKQPSDVIYSYRLFCDSLPKEKADKCVLLMHTNPTDNNGTDLYAVKDAVCPDYDVKISTNRLKQEELNQLYNLSTVTINIAGNEGHGLTTHESILAGTPIITTVTGGLQDQCGFTYNGKPFTADDYVEIQSLHSPQWEDKLKWGDWAYPIWAATKTIIGSVTTPYIFDDKVNSEDVSKTIKVVYDIDRKILKENGVKGREWMLGDGEFSVDDMSEEMIKAVNTTLENWEVPARFKLYKI